MSPLPINPLLVEEKNQLSSQNVWIWLYEVEVPTPTASRYRFCRCSDPISFRGNTYYPFPISHKGQRESDSGDLGTVTLVISNVTREIVSSLEEYNGLIDQSCRIMLVSTVDTSASSVVMEQDFRVVSTRIDEESVTMSIGNRSLYESRVPSQSMMRNYCRHQYRSSACGYSVSPSSPFYLPNCDKSYNGSNGCISHGASEQSAGVPQIHPARFGGFRGIPVPTTSGVL